MNWVRQWERLNEMPLTVPELTFQADWLIAFADVSSLPYSRQLSPPRLAAVIDLRYAVGREIFESLTAFLANLESQEYAAAAHALLHFPWPPDLGQRMAHDARIIRKGEW